jgi:hypothetical protein
MAVPSSYMEGGLGEQAVPKNLSGTCLFWSQCGNPMIIFNELSVTENFQHCPAHDCSAKGYRDLKIYGGLSRHVDAAGAAIPTYRMLVRLWCHVRRLRRRSVHVYLGMHM